MVCALTQSHAPADVAAYDIRRAAFSPYRHHNANRSSGASARANPTMTTRTIGNASKFLDNGLMITSCQHFAIPTVSWSSHLALVQWSTEMTYRGVLATIDIPCRSWRMQLIWFRAPSRMEGIGAEALAPLLGMPHLIVPCEPPFALCLLPPLEYWTHKRQHSRTASV